MAEAAKQAAKLFDRGLAALNSGDLATARASFDRVIRLAPRVSAAHHLSGIVAQNQGRLTDADAAISRAIALDPREPDFFSNRALVRTGLRQFHRAIADAEAALALQPDHRAALTNLGLAQIAAEQHAEAAKTLQLLVASYPTFPPGHGNLGIALNGLTQYAEARAAFEAGLALAPDNLEMLRGLGDALCKLDDIRGALRSYRRAIELQPDHPGTWSSYLFNLNYAGDVAPSEKASIAREFGRRLESSVRPLAARPAPREDRPLRIGFVSGDLRTHSVSLFLLDLLPALQQLGDELFAYSASRHSDATTERLRPSFSGWRDISATSDAEAARLIGTDAIDILIDLSGHSAGNRLTLFALKPAPIAMTWLGYSATTGLSRIDYVIADHHVLPPEVEPLFTERPLRLPDSFVSFTPHAFEPPDYSADAGITFGSFNTTLKLSDTTVAAWSGILHRVPDSRLLIKDARMAYEAARHAMTKRFLAHGISAERLILMARTASREDHFALYGQLTMALDPFPYAGTTTTMEALTAGVPVLTLNEGGFINRVGASLLTTAGLTDWIATDLDDYVDRAVALVAKAQQREFRRQVREQVLASPLCDPMRHAAALHTALHEAWRSSGNR